jgi:predicted small metal-binding protein
VRSGDRTSSLAGVLLCRPATDLVPILELPEMGGLVFEFICDHIVPGCTHKETGDTPEAAREKARAHLHKHHDMSYIDEPLMERIDTIAVRQLR